jgi:hypothetical protein
MFKPNRFVPITAPTVTYATEPEPEPEPVYADEFPDAEPTVPERQTKRLPGEKLLKKLWKTQQKKTETARRRQTGNVVAALAP